MRLRMAFRPRLRLDIVLNDLVAAALTTGRVYIKSDGTPWRPIVHIRDIIGAAVAVLESPREVVHNQTFNVGRNDENFRIRELGGDCCGDRSRQQVEYAPGAVRTFAAIGSTSTKSAAWSRFRPQWTARKGAQELYEAYRKIGLTAADIEQGRYVRISEIRRLRKPGNWIAILRWSRTVRRNCP